MTEQEWLNCEDPARMITLITKGFDGCIGVAKEKQKPFQYRASDYKLWKWINACREATKRKPDEWICHEGDEECDLRPIINTWSNHVYWSREYPLSLRANLLREVIGNPFKPIILPKQRMLISAGPFTIDDDYIVDAELGPEFCPILTWRDGLIPKTAQDIHDNERWEEMGILADMCEDAGCDNQDLLMHLRGKERCPVCIGQGTVIVQCDPDQHPWRTDIEMCELCGDGKEPGSGWIPLRGSKIVKSVPTTLNCPKCDKRGYRRHGAYFDHMFRCGECNISWEPGKDFDKVEEVSPHVKGCHVLDALTGRE